MNPFVLTLGCLLAIILTGIRILWQIFLKRPTFIVEYRLREKLARDARRTMVERICTGPCEKTDETRESVVDVVLAQWLQEGIPPWHRWGGAVRWFLRLEILNVASIVMSVPILLVLLVFSPFMPETGTAMAGYCAVVLSSTVFVSMVVTLFAGFCCMKLHEKRTTDIGEK